MYIPQGCSKIWEGMEEFFCPKKLFFFLYGNLQDLDVFWLFLFGGRGCRVWEEGEGWLKIIRHIWGLKLLWLTSSWCPIHLCMIPSVSQSVHSLVSWAISNAASQVVSLSVCWQTSSLSSAASQSIYLSVCPSVRQPANQSVSWSVYHSVSHTKLNLKSYLCDGSLSGDIFMTATTFPRSSYSTSLMPGGRPYWACWQTNW